MIDPDLKNQLDQINQNLAEIKKKTGGSLWRSFFSGVLSALGYIVGLAIVVVILGWVLQRTGLLPSFEAQVKNFTDLVNSAKQLLPSNNNSDKTTKPQSNSQSGGESTITLPNGQTVKMVLPVQ